MQEQPKNKVQRTVIVGVFAAVLAVLSQLSIPLPTGVPVTLQTFAAALCGFALGPALGTLAVGVYLVLGAIGVPVFAGFSGGFGSLLGMTGGYLWGFLFMAFLCGWGSRLHNRVWAVALGFGGLAVCHFLGAGQFALVMDVSLLQAFFTASAPYLLKDIVSLVAAYFAAMAVLAALKRAKLGGVL